ncbi:unnamed protein product [Strongylus vulgaris]|uniref:Uncharacterized protein n=1 Tax=Strongylus vulgaris TaxID=40348 RepID=A0A3P7JA47_STRVU|nr:unnamed protein product [Strongylus vulgaris]
MDAAETTVSPAIEMAQQDNISADVEQTEKEQPEEGTSDADVNERLVEDFAEGSDMLLNSQEIDRCQAQRDALAAYAEKLKQWKHTVKCANDELMTAIQAVKETGANAEDFQAKEGILMMMSGCVHTITAPKL